MTTELTPHEQVQPKVKIIRQGGSGGDAVYGIGLFGAWAYYLGKASTFKEGALGVLKGFVWPAMLVYELFNFFHKEPDLS